MVNPLWHQRRVQATTRLLSSSKITTNHFLISNDGREIETLSTCRLGVCQSSTSSRTTSRILLSPSRSPFFIIRLSFHIISSDPLSPIFSLHYPLQLCFIIFSELPDISDRDMESLRTKGHKERK